MGLRRGRNALRSIANDQVWQWPVWARVGFGVFALVYTASAWGKRGAAIGVLALTVVALMTVVAIAGERGARWLRRHRAAGQMAGAVLCGAMIFLALALVTNWSVTRCALQAAGSVCAIACWRAWQRYWYGQRS